MKPFKFCAAICVAACMFILASCNSGGEKKADDAATTDSAVKNETPAPPPTAPAKPSNTLLVWHKVANFAKWLALYESHDSVRQSYGLHNYVIGRSLSDSNMVMVALSMDDADKATQFSALPDLKAAMQKGGVLGAPKFFYVDVQMLDNSTNASTTRLMIMHKVKDWDAWKKEFDSHKQVRADAGLTDRAVGFSIGDNHNVIVVDAVNDLKKAEAFAKSKDLKDRMTAAGVESAPEMFWYTVAKKY
ncbi:MAG: hypothetical protein IPP72_03170 [Chitinophagaceae bacterium]|nr:hypothetical protein [Chitinophagaceae bacterium]